MMTLFSMSSISLSPNTSELLLLLLNLVHDAESFVAAAIDRTMHMGQEERCSTNLALGIGGCGEEFSSTSNKSHGDRRIKKRPPVQLHVLFPEKENDAGDQEDYCSIRASLSCSRSRGTDEELSGTRKKLRLTTEQVALLEDSFREHNILNPVQKQGLADRLSIQPRQVEVWFQNRRARTKLKQTEADCEYLKKRCDSLSNENKRLRKELQELEAMSGRPRSPLYMHLLKAAKLTMCASCEQVAATGVGRSSMSGGSNGGVEDRLLSAVNGGRILSL